jgi:hypothetical protein
MQCCRLLLGLMLISSAWAVQQPAKVDAAVGSARAQRIREAADVVARQSRLSRADLDAIRYWDAGPPSYRWNQIAIQIVRADQSGVRPERALALLNIAIHDAIVEANLRNKRSPASSPKRLDPRIRELVHPAQDTGVSTRAAAAGATQAILEYLLPAQAQYIAEKRRLATESRIHAGVSLPADIDAGLAIGRAAAETVINWGKQDNSNAPWTGSIPTKPGKWTGKDPQDPQIAKWKPFILNRPDEFRPPPVEYQPADMQDLTIPTSRGMKAAAYRWQGTPVWQYWNEALGKKFLEDRIEDPETTARAYAMLHVSMYDALVVATDAKYEYWTIRPFQFDPKFKNLIATPNSPGYPSSNAMLSAAAARVLGHFFPSDQAAFWTIAEEAAYAAVWAGVHFKIDTDVGLQIGRELGDLTIKQYRPNHVRELMATANHATSTGGR